ncbi:MAG: thioredoxin [Candidatus Omnitrophota bacterium]
MKEFNESNFEQEVLKSAAPVLVDFWAPWCGPCKAIAPIIEQLSRDFQDKMTVGKVNVDDNPGIAQSSSVMNIPTMIIYKDGQEVSRIVGLRTKEEISGKMQEAIR